ncbi:MAG: HIT family protein [Candidatus Dormibacteraeota bacterium]|nr:HIT family protein [Candidatus Dormibacteraeota bacterium]MBO0703137.1 HIT family protein [Candidatus Dormibacteraeota bacterium]
MNSGVRCVICSARGGRPRGVIAELAASWVTAEVEAPLPGYVCVVSKRHVKEPFGLPKATRQAFFEDCMVVARALDQLLAPRKLNYEIHGNTVPHLHMHLYPRYPGDPYEGGPIGNTVTFRRTPEELAGIADAVLMVWEEQSGGD